ncbi:MAG TPA: glycoside hydrolase domain-containing protein [Prolixibacteraceae bacterium]|nr:glycoside hydrolase domain-containing protein [Prolixibacteraceae bacterium]
MKVIVFILLYLICHIAIAQDFSYSRVGKSNYKELIDPNPAIDADWLKVNEQVNVSFASSNTRFAKHSVPGISVTSTHHMTGWKGEKIHTQVLIWSKKNLPSVQLKVEDLVGSKGQRIDKKQLNASFIRYVMTDMFIPDCAKHRVNEYDSSLVADPIDLVTALSIEAQTVQPIWLSVQLPADIPADIYTGSIVIEADKKYSLTLSVNVLNHVLPDPSEWKFDLDLWQHPAAIARVHNTAIWSKEHFEIMKPYYQMLAKAGQKNITTSIIHEPWNHQTYDDYPSLIRWIKKKDGTWLYDYSLFDQYVSLVMSCGIQKRINCYTMIPWKLSFPYYDEALEKDTVLEAAPVSPEYRAFWTNMLTDFTQHLKSKGWFEITSISIDERPLESMKAAFAVLKAVDPSWKITVAGDQYHQEIDEEVFEYSIASKWKFDESILKARKEQGKPRTFYTCCVEERPNGYTFSPPAENAWLGWYASANGFTGYLRWAFNSWTKEPLRDSRFTAFPAGDTYQVYPGPRTSIRFEKLIEGIQDYEKIRILREQFFNSGDWEKVKELDEILSAFQIQNLERTSASEMISHAKKLLDNL